MRNKKTTLEEYCRIKFDIKCVFLFPLILKQNTQLKHTLSITFFTKPTSPQRLTLTSKS